jgi:hypothetical protein
VTSQEPIDRVKKLALLAGLLGDARATNQKTWHLIEGLELLVPDFMTRSEVDRIVQSDD